MQAITVKLTGPTDSRGAKLVASCVTGTLREQYNYEDKNQQAVKLVAKLVEKLGWTNISDWIGGELPDGTLVFVCAGRHPPLTAPLQDAAFANGGGYQVRL